MGSDESHFNVSLIVRDKVTRQCPHTTVFEKKGEPKWIRTETEIPLLANLTPPWGQPHVKSASLPAVAAPTFLCLHATIFIG